MKIDKNNKDSLPTESFIKPVILRESLKPISKSVKIIDNSYNKQDVKDTIAKDQLKVSKDVSEINGIIIDKSKTKEGE